MSSEHEVTEETFRAVFICSGNQCRSPLAERIFRSLTADLPVAVASLGTLEIPPTRPPQDMVVAAAAIGIDLFHHESRSIAELDLSSADLVIGFEHAHLATAVVEHAARAENSFLLGELVRLVHENAFEVDGSVQTARDAVRHAHEVRQAQPRYVPTDDVIDPIGRSIAVYRDVVLRIDELCRELARSLFARVG